MEFVARRFEPRARARGPTPPAPGCAVVAVGAWRRRPEGKQGRSSGSTVIRWALALSCNFAASCTSRQPADAARGGSTEIAAPEPAATTTDTLAPPRSRASRIEASIVPLGSVPYDDFTLPITSFDGAFVATQRGAAPSWPALLAAPGAASPTGSEVAIYAVGQGRSPVGVGTVAAPALLGRGADADGVLIESPRPDGSRAIGRAAWFDGSVEWLVDDGNVNAFAAMGSSGAMAWSRRTVTARDFELVVRHAGAGGGVTAGTGAERDTVILGEPGASFLLPTFTSDGRTLVAFELRDGVLRLATIEVEGLSAGVIDAGAAGNPAIRRTVLTDRGTAQLAWQMLGSMRGAFHGLGEPLDAFLFVSTRPERVAIWSTERETGSNLATGSLAACFTGADRLLVAFADRLAVQMLDAAESNDFAERTATRGVSTPSGAARLDTILDGMYIPRPVTPTVGSALLLSPRSGTVSIVALRLDRVVESGRGR